MFELILYNISSAWLLVASFLILFFFIGCILYIKIRNFSFKDKKIKLYGLLLSIKNKNIFVFSIIIVRTFLIIFSLVTYQKNIEMYLTMILIVSGLLVIFYFKNMLYEIINSIALSAIIYFIYQLNNYLISVENAVSIQIMKTILISFATLYTTYLFIKEFEDITVNHQNINE